MKKLLVVVLLALSFILVSCKGNEEINFVLDWTPNTNHTGIYVAQEKGFFEERGLKVNILMPPEDGATPMVAAGKAQFGVDFQDMLAAAFSQNDPITVTSVYAILSNNTSGIISAKDKDINSAKDLEDKKYATWDMPIEKAIIKKVMEDEGADFSKLNLIPSTVTDVMTALSTDMDAIWVYYGWDGVISKVKDVDTNFFYFKDISPVLNYYSPVIVGNNKYIEENKKATKKFIEAVQEGYKFAAENPEETAEILVKAVPELDKDIVLASQEYLANEYKDGNGEFGVVESSRWNDFYKWLFENKLIEIEIPENFGFTNEFVK